MTPVYNTRRFSYDKNSKQFTAFASDLEMKLTPREFYLESQRTGDQMTCTKLEEHKDAEGDIAYWLYRPVDNPNLFSVVIFND